MCLCVHTQEIGLLVTKRNTRDAWVAQSVQHVTLDLRVVGSSPTLGVGLTLKKKINRKTNKLKKSFFLTFIHFRETEHEWGRRREREGDRIGSRIQAPRCQHRALRGARTREPRDHDLS